MGTDSFKIFLVDDNIFHLNLMNQMLIDLSYQDNYLFTSGVDCLENIHLNPDIVFLDHNMDTYTGYEVLKKIKRYDPNIFVVMVSSQEAVKTAVDTLKHGAFDYIEKDDHLEKNLENTLKKIIEVKELLQAKKPSLLKRLFKYM
ncbi:MAG: response regulator [Bacteroidales bacterium]|nr:response regulator [Bacteroidales bacterium]